VTSDAMVLRLMKNDGIYRRIKENLIIEEVVGAVSGVASV
jgi:hypothetical protein